ncbi:Myb transcription factor, putative [Talaromyces stipitatus ATCC 10500]|uniref:Myb transcription factor, putative n=1 Tax=Talaromyces stipitatus (strain ATCC 10500 / CBS 375.48 / QM 6759 / NRRL 1006) TaxID=441959 RepID=B8MPT4_TALSN|nr:Myb transcription factor, putative [Talaromyces stipitatus ATCC 10500]EED12742.1 Myb transcription factor, putative [Talaromyces stipitatus ATCC 10500]
MPQPPNRWTPEEDQLLRQEVLAQLSQGGVRDWQNIAAKLPGRTNKDCRKRWHNVVAGGMNKGHWTDAEDKLLIDAVNTHGKSWTVVADVVKTRNAEQCSKRWKQSLDPQLNRSQWTEEENKLLLEAYKVKGSQWKEIQVEYFPTRSRNTIKNQFTILCRRGQKGTRANKNDQGEQVSDEFEAALNDQNEVDGISLSDDDLSDVDPMFEILTSEDDREMSTHPVQTWNLDSGMNSSHSSTNMELATMNNPSMNTFSNIAQTQASADMASWISLEQLFSNYPHTVSDTQHTSYGFENLPPDMMDFSACSATQERLLTSDLTSARSMKDSVQRPPTADSMDYDSSPEKVTLTIYNPNSETVECLIRIAMTNKSGFRLERS